MVQYRTIFDELTQVQQPERKVAAAKLELRLSIRGVSWSR
jgi:hypothetical protein